LKTARSSLTILQACKKSNQKSDSLSILLTATARRAAREKQTNKQTNKQANEIFVILVKYSFGYHEWAMPNSAVLCQGLHIKAAAVTSR